MSVAWPLAHARGAQRRVSFAVSSLTIVAVAGVVGTLAWRPMIAIALVVVPCLFALMVARPPYALALFAAVSFGAPVKISAGGFFTLEKACGMLLVLAFITHAVINRKRIRVSSFTTGPFILLLAWTLFEIVRSHHAGRLIEGPYTQGVVVASTRLAMYLALYIVIINICRTVKDARLVVAGILFAVAIGSIYSILIANQLAPPLFGSQEEFQLSGRVAGLRGQVNEAAVIAVMGLGLVIPFLLADRMPPADRRPASSRLGFLVLSATLILSGVGVFLSGSRLGLVAAGIVIVYVSASRGRFRRKGLVPALLISIAGISALLPTSSSVSSHLKKIPLVHDAIAGGSVIEEDSSAAHRYEALTVVFALAGENPLIGAGYGTFENEMEERVGYGIPVHNVYAEFLAEQGLIGFVIFVAFVFAIARRFREVERSAGRDGEERLRVTAQAFHLSLVAFMITALFLNADELTKVIFIYLGMADALRTIARAPSSETGTDPSRVNENRGEV